MVAAATPARGWARDFASGFRLLMAGLIGRNNAWAWSGIFPLLFFGFVTDLDVPERWLAAFFTVLSLGLMAEMLERELAATLAFTGALPLRVSERALVLLPQLAFAALI